MMACSLRGSFGISANLLFLGWAPSAQLSPDGGVRGFFGFLPLFLSLNQRTIRLPMTKACRISCAVLACFCLLSSSWNSSMSSNVTGGGGGDASLADCPGVVASALAERLRTGGPLGLLPI